MLIAKGSRAPDLDLPSTSGGRVSLSQLSGQVVVFVFYPGDFTPVCTSELALFEQARSEIEARGARLFGISTDSLESHLKFVAAQNLGFPLLADNDPQGEASRAYHSYNQESGESKRSLFVIDADGRVFWSHLSPDEVNPGADGVLEALDELAPRRNSAAAGTRQAVHSIGPNSAAVTLTEFGDYQCPYCGEAYQELKRVFAHFGGKLRFEFRNFPLTSIHPYAEMAAEAAEAAGSQGRFWEMHDGLYENQGALSADMVVSLSEQLGLDTKRLADETNAHAYLPRIRADVEDGLRAGVNGTPSFFINGQRHQDSFDASTLIRAIEETLNAQADEG